MKHIIEEGLRMIQANDTYPVHKIAFKYAYELEKYKVDKIEFVKALGKSENMIVEVNKAIELRKFSDRMKGL